MQGRGVEPSILACLHSSDGLSRGGAAHHRQWLQERGGKSPEQCLQVSNCHFESSILVEISVIKNQVQMLLWIPSDGCSIGPL